MAWENWEIARDSTFMPVVQYEPDLSKTTEISRFLSDCQRSAVRQKEAKIASLSFSISPIAPWNVLAALGQSNQRHFYYDPPDQMSIVGIQSVVDCCAAGRDRFNQAQSFVQRWQARFIHESFVDKTFSSPTARPAASTRHFLCSTTFFEKTTTRFEPVCVFVPQIQVITCPNHSTVIFNFLVTAETDLDQAASSISQQLWHLESAQSTGFESALAQRQVSRTVDGFDLAVSAVLKQMNQQGLHKVVLADVMDVVAEEPFDQVRSLQTLRQNHPDCTVFSIGNGRGQSFIGASPERLLSIRDGQITTDALAGSAPRGATPSVDIQLAQTLLNSAKERYEHRVVVDFLLAQLRSLGLAPHYTGDPQLLRLFHIQHLHTPISAALNAHDISPLEVLNKLHPTPAVAGVPRQQACKLIRQQETFDRGPYAAPLGWIDTQGNSEFIVGIRSALLDGRNARLYAGAGIVAGSRPDKELAEIKLKLQTLLNALS